ncbi:hypothetical protein ACM66B_007007 [Microbotryomycetes sp. NB124-2]
MSKRTASDAFQDTSAQSTGIPEWVPQGEDPAEREKRIKREKRALRLQQLEQQQQQQHQQLSHGQTSEYGRTRESRDEPRRGWNNELAAASQSDYRQDEPVTVSTAGALETASITRPESVADSATDDVNKKGKNSQAKTPARLKYLQRKKVRAKAKKASTPKDRSAVATTATSENGETRNESDSESDEADGEELDEAAKEEKRKIIEQKKAERKRKRDEKKQEIKRLKAQGLSKAQIEEHLARTAPLKTSTSEASASRQPSPEKPVSKPVVVAAKAASPVKATATTTVVNLPATAEPDDEEKKAAAEKAAARLARKEAKRMKREARKSKAVEEELAKVQAEQYGEETVQQAETEDVNMETTEEPPAGQEEPAPLLRLPGATRPQPPSKKVLRNLNIHESVKNKQVVDPDLKVAVSDESLGVSERGQKRLKDMDVREAFAVQTATFPLLLVQSPNSVYSPFEPIRDVCVSAPTGSGKTLSYLVPIVEVLSSRVVTRLRALVLLPTRDLVSQVRETFEQFGKGTGLKIGVATGQHSFSHEQSALVGDVTESHQGRSSLVDILIATPGRLIDHLRSTPGFSLQHLRFLVVDEADRLLTQSFHDWLPTILTALKPLSNMDQDKANVAVLAPDWLDAQQAGDRTELESAAHSSCQKLLFSATLSRDSAKIDALQLNRPVYISVEDKLDPNAEEDDDLIDGELKFTLPSQLEEHMIISEAAHKPLYLFHLLHTLSVSSALCFTKSVEAATRLAKLVEFFEQALANSQEGETLSSSAVVVKAYSSDLAPGERQKILSSFKQGQIQMLICSDLIARGIDLPHVSHVISYDIPSDMRKYVHRVGRTARAGKRGDAWSLVEDQEVAPFRSIMKTAQHWDKIKRVRVKESAVEPFVAAYQVALEKLRAHFATT